jgi:hypothetical protein
MTSFAGIITAIATIMASASAILGVLYQHQATQLKQAHATVSQQAQQINALKVSAAQKTATPTESASPVAAPAPTSGAVRYLADLTPTVDNGNISPGQQVIAAQPYPKSIMFYCNGGANDQPIEAYDVAGSSTFTANAGIPDSMQNATDVAATLTFTNESGRQIGSPVQVSLGHPVKIDLNITGVTQLGLTCAGRNMSTSQSVYEFEVAFGNAGVSS